MANQRVVDADVKQILVTTLDTQPFIVAANLVVTERFATSGYSEARLQQLELWLAAHLACIADPRVVELDADGATATYEAGKLGMGLDSTRYGQQIKWLDYLGILLQDNASLRPASFRVD
jgi:hypothetical protein